MHFPLWALDDSHSDTGVAGMEDMYDCVTAEHQPLLSLGLLIFYGTQLKISQGKEWNQ